MVVVLVQTHHQQLMEHLMLEAMVALVVVVAEIKLEQELQLLAEEVCIQEAHLSAQHDKVMMVEVELV